jgi:glycosyltransferase involved in cell wall biosynthesis
LKNRLYYFPYKVICKTNRLGLHNISERKIILANSKFTSNAIREVRNVNPHVVYPPINKIIFEKPKSVHTLPREDLVVTVSRISPEKMLENIPHIASLTNKKIRFLIIGLLYSQNTFYSIKKAIKKYQVSTRVKILPNLPHNHLQELLLRSKVYLHSAVDEHFGISIVEAMASGCIPIVHNSGGPREYIPKKLRYYTIQEAAKQVEKEIYEWSPKKSKQLIQVAQQFHQKEFSKKIIEIFQPVSR